MMRVGLTGGIGSGKSTVAGVLRELGAVVTDADRVAREVVEPGAPALRAIRERFGEKVIHPDGRLDRAGLAAVVFPDPAALRALEAITGPAIAARVAQLRAAVPVHRVDVYDMPLLVEKGLWVHEHLTLVVGASEQTRLARLVEQRGIPLPDARARIAAQATDEQRREAADVWIDNEGSREDTEDTVRRVWAGRLRPYQVGLVEGRRAKRPDRLALQLPDPGWADAGARVVARLAAALHGRGVSVEHVGSTSVPGLVAKDVIDVQIGVRSLTDADDPGFVAALRRAGYLLVEGNEQDHPHPVDAPATQWQKRFYGGCDPGRVVNVHVRQVGSGGHRFALAFRDWLRAEPDARAAYTAEKRRLARQFARTTDYARAKEEWFAQAYPQVQAWLAATGRRPG
jgi:dephospho-CoA kinase